MPRRSASIALVCASILAVPAIARAGTVTVPRHRLTVAPGSHVRVPVRVSRVRMCTLRGGGTRATIRTAGARRAVLRFRVPKHARPGRRRLRLVCRPNTRARVIRLRVMARAACTVRSPDSGIGATLRITGGEATLRVTRDARPVLSASLGSIALRRVRVRRGTVADSYATAAGKRRVHQLDAHRLAVTVGGGRNVEVIAADDGVAYRQTGAGPEHSAWSAPGGTRAWLQRFDTSYEGRYEPTSLDAAPARAYGFPALLATPGGGWALLTESGLPYGAAAAHLRVSRRHPWSLGLRLPLGERSPETTGWRVAVLGTPATIAGSDLPLSLGRASEIADASWIRPGRAAWSWWSDSASPASLTRQRDFVDFAAERGWEYTLVDEGWDASWVPGLARYAAGRGVRLLLWSDWHDLADPARRDTLLDTWAAWGIAGIKVDFLKSDSGARMAVMEDIARAAAKRHLLVDFHGCTIPRGLQRTWPNVMTMEGVHGAEYAKAGEPISPANDVTLAFTRNAIGSMDYTPVTFSAPGRVSSAGHQLAAAVVFESGVQHYADSPESYRRYPGALGVLERVPAAWDDSVLVDGTPDSFVTIARRSGTSWFVGSLAAGPARTLSVPLRFLGAGRYDARITEDAGSGLGVEQRTVTAADTLRLPLAANGGAVIELTLAR